MMETITPKALVAALKKAGKTISSAESCTGGLIAKRLTDIPGASDTARYKALGNSVAVPCVETVLAAVQNYLRWEEKD